MKTFLLTTLLGCSTLLSFGQANNEVKFDKAHTVDYLVVYDQSNPGGFIESRGGREAYAQEIVDSINSVLRNSHIDYRFRVAGVHYLENYQAESIIKGHEYVSQNAEVQAIRQATKADIVVLLTETFGDPDSGLADHKDDAIHTDAYSCVNLRMAATSYTAAHEAGHIMGGYHSRHPEEQAPSQHNWAAAFTTEGYRTVLCGMAPGITVPIYSGPDSYWKGVRMGDENNDNVRMIRHNLPRVVQFGEHLDPNLYYSSVDELRFTKNPQQGEVSFYGNQFMLINANAGWIQGLNPTWGNVQADVKFQLEPNTTGADRTAEITVSGDAPTTKTVKIIQTAADVIIDSDHGVYNQHQDNFVDQLQFVRTFHNTEWQALCIPFIWRYNDWKDLFEIAQIKTVKETAEGEALMTIEPLTSGDLQAHTPYMIRAKKADQYVLNLKYINCFAATTPSTEFIAGNQKFTFTGTYQGVAGQEMYNNGYYGMSNGVLAPTNNVEAQLKSFRWYLKITDNEGRPLTAPLKIKVIEQGGDATGIEQLQQDSPTFKIYDLKGRLLKRNAKDTKHLPSGVYIINGKKVVL